MPEASGGNRFANEVRDLRATGLQKRPTSREATCVKAIEALPGELREAFRMVWCLGRDRESAAKAMGSSVRKLGGMWHESRK